MAPTIASSARASELLTATVVTPEIVSRSGNATRRLALVIANLGWGGAQKVLTAMANHWASIGLGDHADLGRWSSGGLLLSAAAAGSTGLSGRVPRPRTASARRCSAMAGASPRCARPSAPPGGGGDLVSLRDQRVDRPGHARPRRSGDRLRARRSRSGIAASRVAVSAQADLSAGRQPGGADRGCTRPVRAQRFGGAARSSPIRCRRSVSGRTMTGASSPALAISSRSRDSIC